MKKYTQKELQAQAFAKHFIGKIEKNSIRARLTINGMGGMTTKEFNTLRRWIMKTALEMQKAKQSDYSKKYRATLYR